MTTTTTEITADTELTESDTRATRLQVLEAQVCRARDDISSARYWDEPSAALGALHDLATILQHTLQELAHLAVELSPS